MSSGAPFDWTFPQAFEGNVAPPADVTTVSQQARAATTISRQGTTETTVSHQ